MWYEILSLFITAWWESVTHYKSQLLPTDRAIAFTLIVLYATVDAHCDKLATDERHQRALAKFFKYRVWDKVPRGSTLILGDIPITFQHSVVEGSLCAKTSSIRSAFLLRLVTDRRTDRYTATANTALAQRCAGKNWRWISLALWL